MTYEPVQRLQADSEKTRLFCTGYQPSGSTGTSLALGEFSFWECLSSPSIKITLPLSFPTFREFPYLFAFELGTKGSCYYCKRTIILTTIPYRVLYLFLQMEKLRPRGLLLIWKERGKLRTHVWLSEDSLLYTVWLLVSRSVNCNLSSLLFWASVHISPLLDISFSALFLGDVSFCFTLAAATPAWAPLTSFTGSANIDPLPSGSSQSVVQAIKSAFWPLPYPCPIYQPDNINKPPCWYNLRHIHWVPTLCQVLFWVLKKKNYKFTDLTVYNAFYLSHRGFRKDITSQLNWP